MAWHAFLLLLAHWNYPAKLHPNFKHEIPTTIKIENRLVARQKIKNELVLVHKKSIGPQNELSCSN